MSKNFKNPAAAFYAKKQEAEEPKPVESVEQEADTEEPEPVESVEQEAEEAKPADAEPKPVRKKRQKFNTEPTQVKPESKSKTFLVKLQPTILEYARADAEELGISVNEYFNRALKSYLNRKGE